MKRIIFVLALALVSSFSDVVARVIDFEVCITDPTENHEPLQKGPILTPYVNIEGYTLFFITPCNGCTLRIVNAEDEVEYTTIITSGMLVLPSTLEGDYEIQIISGNYCFYGDIEL